MLVSFAVIKAWPKQFLNETVFFSLQFRTHFLEKPRQDFKEGTWRVQQQRLQREIPEGNVTHAEEKFHM